MNRIFKALVVGVMLLGSSLAFSGVANAGNHGYHKAQVVSVKVVKKPVLCPPSKRVIHRAVVKRAHPHRHVRKLVRHGHRHYYSGHRVGRVCSRC